jgi:SAM-dependent methyltransferase
MDSLDVLDVGCSDGFFSKYFLDNLNANYVLGLDINKYDGSVAFDVLKSYENNFKEKYKNHNDFQELKEEYMSLGLNSPNKYLLIKKIYGLNMDFKEGSIYNLEDFNNFDVTFCGSLLEHLRDPITAIEQLYLATNEFCIIDVSNTFSTKFLRRKPYIEYTNSGGNFFKYSNESIINIMSNVGFKSVSNLSNYKIKIEKYGYKIPHGVFIGYK